MHRAFHAGDAVRIHDGPWGKATMEVILGILDSSANQREVAMQHQVAYKGMGVA